jgi:hypothetical protein
MMKAAPIKIMKVNRAFSRIPRMFKPATPQMIPSTRIILTGSESWKKDVMLAMALTEEMQAVRI